MKKTFLYFVIGLMLVAGGYFLSCCDECPTCPAEEESPPLENYRIYAIDGLNRFLTSIDTPADTIVDSIRIDYDAAGLYLPPNGECVMVMNLTDLKMEVYNAASLEHVETMDQYGDYYFDATDNYGVWIDIPNDQIRFIDPNTLTPSDSIGREIRFGYLDTVSNCFYGNDLHVHNLVYKVDCNTRQLVDSMFMRMPLTDTALDIVVYQMCYNWLTDDLYYLGVPAANTAFFYVYDCETDSVKTLIRIFGPFGSIAISPDGTKVFMTDSGDSIFFIIPDGYIFVYDAYSLDICDLIEPYAYPGGFVYLPCFGKTLFTPDTRRAYVGAGWYMGGGAPLVTVDLSQNKIINIISPYETFSPSDICLGPVPTLE